jgi:hypothetical protein
MASVQHGLSGLLNRVVKQQFNSKAITKPIIKALVIKSLLD